MKDPNDYIVIGVWFVALICVMVIIGAFQSTGQALNTGEYTIENGINALANTYSLQGEGGVKCSHTSLCDGRAITQFVDTKFTSVFETRRGSHVCICLN